MSQYELFSGFNEAWIDRDIRNSGWQGALYFAAIGTLMTACGAPRQLLAFLGGYAFGVSLGFVYSTLATVLGCVSAFYVSKLLIRPIIRKKFNKQAVYINHFLSKQATRKTIIIRLLPVGSNVLTNLIAGTSSVKPSAFFIGSAIGYMPQMLVFALLGKGLLIGSEWKIVSSIVLLLISSYLSVNLYKKYRINVTEPTPSNNAASLQSK
jgi:uncharacterized membrane protein YdjX (TVP38/TMEM64 family)